jgi:hypothetical protein
LPPNVNTIYLSLLRKTRISKKGNIPAEDGKNSADDDCDC